MEGDVRNVGPFVDCRRFRELVIGIGIAIAGTGERRAGLEEVGGIVEVVDQRRRGNADIDYLEQRRGCGYWREAGDLVVSIEDSVMSRIVTEVRPRWFTGIGGDRTHRCIDDIAQIEGKKAATRR